MAQVLTDELHKLGRKGWTITAIAAALGVSRQTVHRWWKGGPPPDSPEMVLLALGALKDREVPAPGKPGPKGPRSEVQAERP